MNKETFDFFRITTVERLLFDSIDLNENMKCFSAKITKALYLVNSKQKKAYILINYDNYLMMNDNCFDYEKIKQKCNMEKIDEAFDIHSKKVNYDFYCVKGFKNRKSIWCWDFYPDGVYLADDDGFCVKPNNEIKLYGVISDEGKVIFPFQPFDLNESEIIEFLMERKYE